MSRPTSLRTTAVLLTVRTLLLVALCAFLIVVVLSACSTGRSQQSSGNPSTTPSVSLPVLRTPVLDLWGVQSTIEDGGYTGVVCNHGHLPSVAVGARFTCTADGDKQLDVTITDSAGDYIWSPH